MKRVTVLLSLITAAVVLAACTTPYHTGERVYSLQRRLNAWQTVLAYPIADVHQATVKGLADLKLEPLTSRADSVAGLVDGNLADGQDYEVKLTALSATSTSITLRCGILGDKNRSFQLFQAIEKHLK